MFNDTNAGRRLVEMRLPFLKFISGLLKAFLPRRTQPTATEALVSKHFWAKPKMAASYNSNFSALFIKQFDKHIQRGNSSSTKALLKNKSVILQHVLYFVLVVQQLISNFLHPNLRDRRNKTNS